MKTAILLSLFLSLSDPLRALGDTTRPGYDHGWGMMPWGMGGMMLMMPVMFLLAIAVIFAVTFMVRRAGDYERREGHLPRADTAMDILKKRYARGEIDQEEYERMKRDLEG